jgi:HEAT repeat protein
MKYLIPIWLCCTALMPAQTPAEKAWSILSTAAQDKSYEKRSKAIQAMGLISGDPRAQAAAEKGLTDEREEVKVAAADALGLMQAKGSIPKLKAALKDPATSVVFAATNALFVMGDPDAYGVYYAVLTGQKKSGDPLMESQLKMLKDPKALSKLGLEAGIGFIPFGGVSYKVVKMVSDDNVSPVRAAAAAKLGRDPDPKSGQALSEAAKDPKWLVRAAVAGAIARRNDAAMLSAVTPLLDDENDIVRFNASAAVVQLSSKGKK